MNIYQNPAISASFLSDFSPLPDEFWIPIPLYPGYRIDIISLRVRNPAGAILKTVWHSMGYRRVLFPFAIDCGLLHRVIMSAIEGRALATTEYVCHIDDDKTNNHPSNLYIGDARTNAADWIRNGGKGRKLTPSKVRALRAARQDGDSLAALAVRFNVRIGTISSIVNRRSWSAIRV